MKGLKFKLKSSARKKIRSASKKGMQPDKLPYDL
jgi:hypothetical protein